MLICSTHCRLYIALLPTASFSQARFVNGARITLQDACERVSVAGALHVIDRVITPACDEHNCTNATK